MTPANGAAFESLSWHDNALYGLRIDIGDIDRGDWRSDLVLDIDHIVEWVCGAAGDVKFRVAPANLVFHDATDLRVAIDLGDSGGQQALSVLSVDRIVRERQKNQKICFDRPYYIWQIVLNWPRGGEITFGASGFSQTLRADPVLHDEQSLRPANRG